MMYVYLLHECMNVCMCMYGEKTTTKLTAVVKSQLPADHLGLTVVPTIVTNRTPLVVYTYLHPPHDVACCSS